MNPQLSSQLADDRARELLRPAPHLPQLLDRLLALSTR
jgi:hypothetical protein